MEPSQSTLSGEEPPHRPEPPYGLIRDCLQKGRVIPFLGAGASLLGRESGAEWSSPDSGFLPNAGELARYLENLSGYPPSSDPGELTRVAQYFDGVAGRFSLEDHLHEIFARSYRPGPLHNFLTCFPKLLIVTTNYDCLLETAFREAQKPFHLVVYKAGTPSLLFWEHGHGGEPKEVAANEFDPGLGEVPVVFKMHGAADAGDPKRGSYVITEDDYVEFLTRLADTTAIPVGFAEPFRRSHFLFLGYGLRDWNLRVILHKIWRGLPRRGYASWAIQHRAEPLEQEFWSRREMRIFEMSIADFLVRLDEGNRGGG